MSAMVDNMNVPDQPYPGHSPDEKRRRRILVVEDQALLAAVIADLLGAANNVLCASSIEEAFYYLLCDTVDLPDGPNWQVALEPTFRTYTWC